MPLGAGGTELGLVGSASERWRLGEAGVPDDASLDDWLAGAYAPGRGVDGAAWLRHAFGDRLDLGLVGFYGQAQGGGGGGFFARGSAPHGPVRLGLQIEVGWLWYGVGVPVAVQLGEHWWITTQPLFRAGSAGLPLALAWTGGPWLLQAEGLAWYTPESTRLGTPAALVLSGSVAVGLRLGRPAASSAPSEQARATP